MSRVLLAVLFAVPPPADGRRAGAPPPRAVAEPAGDRPVAVMTDVYPFLKKHCVACHNGAAPRAERSLTGYQDADSIRRDRGAWDDVLRHVEAGSMPPAAGRQPGAGEVEAFVRNVRRLREPADKK